MTAALSASVPFAALNGTEPVGLIAPERLRSHRTEEKILGLRREVLHGKRG